jgi:PKD repeat protein
MNTYSAAELISSDADLNTIEELSLKNNRVYQRTVMAAGGQPLKVTLAWTDKPGTPPMASLDPPDPMVVHELDLRLTESNNTFYPWKLDKDNPSNAATRNEENNVDNVEMVTIDNPTGGTQYTIIVDHDGNITGGGQAFSLIVSGITNTAPQHPIADFEGNPTTVTVGSSVNFTDLSLNNPTSWDWTFTGGTPETSTDQNPTVTYNTEGTYTVSLTATNSEGYDTKTVADYITVNTAGPITYCESSSQSNALEWIANVAIGSYSNPSGASYYTDHTSEVLALSPGSSYSIALTPYYTGKDQREFWRVWIDYNLDGDFEDADETVVIANNKKGTYSTSLTIPSYASGQTRMRVTMKNGSSPSSCETFDGGEVEDYTVDFDGTNMTTRINSNIEDLMIYPNPNNGIFNVNIDGDIHPDSWLRVYDMKGMLLHDMPVSQSCFELDLSKLVVGIYQISVINGNEYYYSKLVKK